MHTYNINVCVYTYITHILFHMNNMCVESRDYFISIILLFYYFMVTFKSKMVFRLISSSIFQ